jgi:hypothetical protein
MRVIIKLLVVELENGFNWISGEWLQLNWWRMASTGLVENGFNWIGGEWLQLDWWRMASTGLVENGYNWISGEWLQLDWYGVQWRHVLNTDVKFQFP